MSLWSACGTSESTPFPLLGIAESCELPVAAWHLPAVQATFTLYGRSPPSACSCLDWMRCPSQPPS
eukprot:2691915-Karenia_brevis.AAC.1